MKRLVLVAAALLPAGDGLAADPAPLRPFEAAAWTVPATPLDALVVAAQRRRGLTPANACSDETFVRRVFLDVIGVLPEPEAVRAFLADGKAGKRAALVETLFLRDEFADRWALKWCDVLRVKSEFPIDLWPNAVQAYHRWIRDAVRTNMPYDRFARELLTSSGSNFRVPAVNFCRALQGRGPQALAAAVALTFMGERVEKWPPARRANMALFFSRVAYKKTAEWKEEIVLCDPSAAEPLESFLPDGTPAIVPAGEDPRRVFADWLVAPANKSFAKAAVNRVWSWLLGRGLVHEPDDLSPDNPASIPEALTYLEREFVGAKFDLRHVFRLVLNSRTYQQSPVPHGGRDAAEALFACYPVRRLDAEVLLDALDKIGGTSESWSSTIPEPYTFLPEGTRAGELADGSVTSPFLEMFGRPARDTGREEERGGEPTDAQRLYLLNSTELERRIVRSPRLSTLFARARGDMAEVIRGTYLVVLSREPLDAEATTARAYFETPGRGQREAAIDLAWALINSKEFLYRH